MRVMDAVKETLLTFRELAHRQSEGLTLETSAIVSLTASNTLINTQLIHQFVSRRADAVTWFS